jgi:general secretion pathway protein C
MKALFVLINLLLLAAASWLAVGLFYQTATGDLAETSVDPVSIRTDGSPDNLPAKPLEAYAVIERRNLFNTGDAPESMEAEERLDIAALKETTLDLKLWGTVTLQDAENDYAVIEDKKGRRQQLYRVGDVIQNAVVKGILRKKVVLRVNGKDEVLTMEETLEAGETGGAQPAGPPPELAARETVVDRETVSEAMANIGELMRQVRVRPYFEDGQPAGLSLTGLRPDSLFRKFGIRSGDVLQAVEGEPIRSVEDVVNLYQKLSEMEGVTVQIKRRGQVQDLRFQIR